MRAGVGSSALKFTKSAVREAFSSAVASSGHPDASLVFTASVYQEKLQALVDEIGRGVPFLDALTFGEIGSFHDVPLFHSKTVSAAVLGSA